MKKQMKRITSFVIVVVMTLMAVQGVTVLAEEKTILTEEQEGLLQYLGVNVIGLDDSASITRSELAHIVAIGNKASSYTGEPFFYDVPVGHHRWNNINQLANMGVISGDGNGYYRPDDIATETEACKLFATVLGYGEIGYFEEYLKTARRVGILDGVSVDGVLTVEDAKMMAYNTLHCSMLETVTYGDPKDFKVQEGFYAIERYHNLRCMRGVVKGFYGTTLTEADNSLEKDDILINGKRYVYPGGETLIGQSVIYYVECDRHRELTNIISYIYADKEKNHVLVVDAEDIGGKLGKTFCYWVNGKEKKVELAETIDVIYNKMAYPHCQDAEFKPQDGMVTLIDHNDDNIYDVAVIDAYTYMVVERSDIENKIIYARYPEGGKVGDINNENVALEAYRDGKLTYSGAIDNGDVVAISASKNKDGMKKISMSVIEQEVQGKINRMEGQSIWLNDTEYKLSNATVLDRAPEVGEFVTMYLYQGAPAVILHPENEGYQLGYLLDAMSNSKSFSSELKVRLVDSSYELREYVGAKKVFVDEVLYTDMDKVMVELKLSGARTFASGEAKYPLSQLIRYKVNNDGLLTHMDTNIKKVGENEDSLELQVSAGSTTADKKYLSLYNQTFYTGKGTSGETTDVVFSFPSTLDLWQVPEYNQNRDMTEWYLKENLEDGAAYYVEGYNVDPDTKMAEYAVAYIYTPNQTPQSAPLFIVKEVSLTLNEEGDIVRQLEAIGAGGVVLKIPMDFSLQNVPLSVGDVIGVRNNYKATELEYFSHFYRVDEIPTERLYWGGGVNGTEFSRRQRAVYGTILSVKDGVITHTTSIKEDIEDGGVGSKKGFNVYRSDSGTKVYIYDTETPALGIREGSLNDIMAENDEAGFGDHAVLYTQTGKLKFVYIIR